MISAWPLDRSSYSGKKQFQIVFFAIIIGVVNGLFGILNADILEFPLFMDTIGTLLVTSVWGLWPGALTAVFSHLTNELMRDITGAHFNLPWVLCSLASVLTLSLLIRYKLFENIFHAVLATFLVALANSIIGALVAVFFFSGITLHPVDYIATSFLSLGQSFLSAAFWARVPINIIDKGIAVFIAFTVSLFLQKNKEEARSSLSKSE